MQKTQGQTVHRLADTSKMSFISANKEKCARCAGRAV